jgi:hypothetical protein
MALPAVFMLDSCNENQSSHRIDNRFIDLRMKRAASSNAARLSPAAPAPAAGAATPAAARVLAALRTWGRQPAGELAQRLGISRATLMRAVRELGPAIVTRGKARRTTYAARRAVRGQTSAMTLFRIDADGRGAQVGLLDALHPHGCALLLPDAVAPFAWPLPEAMADGWFDGIPYPLEDMRPQGFLGRHFARQHAGILQVSANPLDWSDDDLLHALGLLGADQPGDLILGDAAYRRFLEQVQQGVPDTPDATTPDTELIDRYVVTAQAALDHGVAGSSAGGEFPKFTERRMVGGKTVHVLVKFSGADAAPGTQRWSDLLVCEHLALQTLAAHLDLAAADSRILQGGARTFLEVVRFDRHGAFGRSAVCSWSALNGALFGLAGMPWHTAAARMQQAGMIDAATRSRIARLWHFGELIGNTDMHDGNLAFRPAAAGSGMLSLAPAYDMLPMLYAPVRGVELPERHLRPSLPMPADQADWHAAATAARLFWQTAGADRRIGKAFRVLCAGNAALLAGLIEKAG